jgi:hypothetical protein
MQVLLVDSPEGSQVHPEHGPSPLTGVTVDLAAAIAIRIPRPLIQAIAHAGVGRMATLTALPLVGVEKRNARRDVFGDEVVTGLFVGVITHPQAVLPRLRWHHTHNGGTVVGEFLRRPCLSARCHSHRSPGTGRQETDPDRK